MQYPDDCDFTSSTLRSTALPFFVPMCKVRLSRGWRFGDARLPVYTSIALSSLIVNASTPHKNGTITFAGFCFPIHLRHWRTLCRASNENNVMVAPTHTGWVNVNTTWYTYRRHTNERVLNACVMFTKTRASSRQIVAGLVIVIVVNVMVSSLKICKLLWGKKKTRVIVFMVIYCAVNGL